MLLKVQLIRKEEHCAELFYEVLLPHLAGANLGVAIKANMGKHGDYETVQRSGTCFIRCALTATRYLLRKRHKVAAVRMKTLFFDVRRRFLKVVEAHLHDERRPPLLDSDVQLIHVGCSQTARAAAKLAHRLVADATTPRDVVCAALQRVAADIEALRDRVNAAVRSQAREGQTATRRARGVPLLGLAKSTSLVEAAPFPGFDLLVVDSAQAERFAGGLKQAPPERFVDARHSSHQPRCPCRAANVSRKPWPRLNSVWRAATCSAPSPARRPASQVACTSSR